MTLNQELGNDFDRPTWGAKDFRKKNINFQNALACDKIS